jgi:hypothetical protein
MAFRGSREFLRAREVENHAGDLETAGGAQADVNRGDLPCTLGRAESEAIAAKIPDICRARTATWQLPPHYVFPSGSSFTQPNIFRISAPWLAESRVIPN